MDFRLGRESELEKVAEIYERILDEEEAGRVTIGWERGVYPTLETARFAFLKEELYVVTPKVGQNRVSISLARFCFTQHIF